MTIAEAIYNSVGALCFVLVVGGFVFLICVAVTEKWPWEK